MSVNVLFLLVQTSRIQRSVSQIPMPKAKGPLIVEKRDDDDETWSVTPTPGLCIKFRDPQMPSSLIAESTNKLFINIVHCIELPPPQRIDLEEDSVAKIIEQDPDAYRIPLCIGEFDSAEDHTGEPVAKIDVVVNSEFFHKRLSSSEYFRQITLRIICESISIKYGVQLDVKKQVILRNKKSIGELKVQRIRKRPLNSLMDPTIKESGSKAETSNVVLVESKNAADGVDEHIDIDDIEDTTPKKPRNFKAQVLDGKYVDIRVRVRDQQGELVKELNRITLKMNDDRVVVLLDGNVVVADFFLTFNVEDECAECTFDAAQAILHIKCPIKWD